MSTIAHSSATVSRVHCVNALGAGERERECAGLLTLFIAAALGLDA